jgi:hypothetical protein
MTDLLFGVWTAPALLSAILTGLGIGYVAIGAVIRNPTFSSGVATPWQNAAVTAVISLIGGSAFWVGQVFAAFADGDPLYWRIASRFTVWLIFCLGLSAGAFLAAHHDRVVRSAAARDRIRREIRPK